MSLEGQSPVIAEKPSEADRPDQERQVLAREYARLQRRWLVIDLLFSFLLVVGFLVSGASRLFKVWLLGWGLTSPWLLVAVYMGLLLIADMLVSLPLAWWRGYVLPKRYELSTQTLKGWLLDELKTTALGLALGIPVAEVIYWLLRSQPETWWLWAAGLLVVLSIVLGFLLPVVILPLFYTLVPLEDAALNARIRELARRTGTRIAGVYTINLSSRTTAGNAMVMGMGATKRIALGDTLYADYTPEEIETILAHELGHQVHRDMELSVGVQSLLLVGSLYLARAFLNWGVAYFGFEGIADVAAFPLLVLATALFSLVTMPLINFYSRWRERLADRFALEVTGNPEAFARAMLRLADQNLSESDPPDWVVWLLYDHPPIRERVSMARRVSPAEIGGAGGA